MTLLVRDEQDIIRENIEFHRSQGVDYFIVTDNKSMDMTPHYLKEYEKKGILHYIFEGEDNYNQHQWVTRMARLAYEEYEADWVINNDADEFWWPKLGDLKVTFTNIPDNFNILSANRHNFVAIDEKDTPFYHNMIYRETTSLNPLGQPLPPKVAHRGSNKVVVMQGNHNVEGLCNPKVIANQIEIFHFPIRSYMQLENKIVKGGAAYERNNELPIAVGGTWRKLYKDFQQYNNLQGHYQKNLYDDKHLKGQLDLGAILIDKRLSRYFTEKNIVQYIE